MALPLGFYGYGGYTVSPNDNDETNEGNIVRENQNETGNMSDMSDKNNDTEILQKLSKLNESEKRRIYKAVEQTEKRKIKEEEKEERKKINAEKLEQKRSEQQKKEEESARKRVEKAKQKEEQENIKSLIKKIKTVQKELEIKTEKLLNSVEGLYSELSKKQSEFEQHRKLRTTNTGIIEDSQEENIALLNFMESGKHGSLGIRAMLLEIKRSRLSLPPDLTEHTYEKLKQIWFEKTALLIETLNWERFVIVNNISLINLPMELVI